MAEPFVPRQSRSTKSGSRAENYDFNANQNPTPAETKFVEGTEAQTLLKKSQADVANAVSLSLPAKTVQNLIDASTAATSPNLNSHQALNTAGQAESPKVNIVKDGDKITHIVVECTCGRAIGLDCVY